MKQLVDGMIFCHSRDVLHRDLKLANILLGEGMTVKVADFGYAKQLQSSASNGGRRERRWSVCGTPNYMPPEVVTVAQSGTRLGPGHSTEADVWCIGIVMYVLLCGIPPFQAVEMTVPATYKNIVNNRWTFGRPDAPGAWAC
jgi:serine/threonine protein kinase